MTRRIGPDAPLVIGQAAREGLPVAAAVVTVTDVNAGAAATLYSDEFLRTTITNPITTGVDGRYQFYVKPGVYSFSIPGADPPENVIIGGVSSVPSGTFVGANPTLNTVVMDGSGNWLSWTEGGVAYTATYNGDGSLATTTVNGVTLAYTYDSTGNLVGAA